MAQLNQLRNIFLLKILYPCNCGIHILVCIEWKIHLKRKLTSTASLKRQGQFCNVRLTIKSVRYVILSSSSSQVYGNIRTMTPCDCTLSYHKCMPCANIVSEEALFSSALFPSRKPMPVHYVCESGVLFHETTLKSGSGGELCLSSHFQV